MRSAVGVFVVALVGSALAQPPPPDVEDFGPVTKQELFAGPNRLIAGTNVYLDHVVVRAKSGTMLRVGWDKHEIFVAPVDPSSLGFITVGAKVNVRGTLAKTPSAGQARLINAMSWSEARRLARQSVYVDAWAMSVEE